MLVSSQQISRRIRYSSFPEPAPIAEVPPSRSLLKKEELVEDFRWSRKVLELKTDPFAAKGVDCHQGQHVFPQEEEKEESAREEGEEEVEEAAPSRLYRSQKRARCQRWKGQRYLLYRVRRSRRKKYRSLAAVLRSVSSSANNCTSRDVVAADAPSQNWLRIRRRPLRRLPQARPYMPIPIIITIPCEEGADAAHPNATLLKVHQRPLRL